MAPRQEQPIAILLTGSTGTGKTRIASLISKFVGPVGAYWKSPGKWYDNYQQEPLLVWDEFRGQESTDIASALTLMNYSPLLVERKGSSVHFNSKWILLTSNLTLEEMFNRADSLSLKALQRRIKQLTVY